MNERKLGKLFEALRNEAAAAPPEHFEQTVLRAIRREPAPPAANLFDQLHALFPKLALAAVGFIVICVLGDWLADAAQLPTLTDGVAQLSQQWLLTGEGF